MAVNASINSNQSMSIDLTVNENGTDIRVMNVNAMFGGTGSTLNVNFNIIDRGRVDTNSADIQAELQGYVRDSINQKLSDMGSPIRV